MLMTASLMMLESLLVSEILVISTFRILVILALGARIEGEEGGADVDGGPLYDLGVVSPVQNLERRRLLWSHRFLCDVTSLLVILLVMRKEEREAPM